MKTQAYQDVEKKLSVFEDEFFADLHDRSDRDAGEAADLAGGDGEPALPSFESDVKERISRRGRVHPVPAGIDAAGDGEGEEGRSRSFEKDLAGVRDTVEAGTRKMHREIETRLKELAVELDAGRKEIAELFEASRAEVTVWEGKARQQLAEAELAIAEKISTLSGEAAASIGTIRDGFAAQREDLLVATNEERTALRAELAQMGESITSSRRSWADPRNGMEILRASWTHSSWTARSACATCRRTSRAGSRSTSSSSPTPGRSPRRCRRSSSARSRRASVCSR